MNKAKKKSTKKITVFLPCGGSLTFPYNTSEETMREKCTVVDPSCASAPLATLENGDRQFVRNMGTKG